MSSDGTPLLRGFTNLSVSNLSVGTDGHVQRLMYMCSVVDLAMWTPKYLAGFEDRVRQRNFRLGISGFLLYSEPYIFQVLEGFPEVVGPLFKVIKRNPRHEKCFVLEDVCCTQRLYSDWQFRAVETADLPVTVANVLPQIAGAFLSMWRYLPRSAADLLLQGKDPREHPPRSQDVVVAFVDIIQF
eukprot:EG_transcript_34706